MIRPVAIILGIFVLFYSATYASCWWVGSQIQNMLELDVEGNIKPQPFNAGFKVEGIRAVWNDRVQLEKGNLLVDYKLIDVLNGLPLRVQFSGEDLGIRLLGDWAKMQGVDQVVLEKLFVDVAVGRGGLEEVYSVFVKSPKLNFEIRENV